jgi:hypothetical protein
MPRFDGENVKITAEKHIQNIEDFLDLFEVEDDDVCIIMFSLSLEGKVKNWFKDLPSTSINNFRQFVNFFLDRWVIMRNVFLILEEYNHLKRQPGETVPQFSTRFNKVYHAMPIDIRPPPGSTHLHYRDAFDPEINFQLRERNTETLEEMKNIVVDVEANLLNRKEKLRAEEKDRTKNERMTSSEMKLDVMENTVKEMMQNIRRNDELVVQRTYVPLVLEQTRINVPKQFAAQPQYFEPSKDYFMYSIHNVVKDEVPTHLVEEPSNDMMCMFDDISFMDDLPKHDRYDEDYIQMDFPKQSTTYCWEEENHLQSQQDSLSVHSNYDINDQSAENIRVSGNTLPLCFSSFQFFKRNSRPVVNSEDSKFFDQSVEDAISDIEVITDSEVHPLSLCVGQNSDENTKPETGNELIHFDSLPLCFSSF